MSYFLERYDLLIALGLVGIVVVTYLISRMGLLPKKSLPFVAAGLAAIFGIALFRKYRSDNLQKELKELEGELKKKEKRLEDLKQTYNVSNEKLQEMKSELVRHQSANEKEILLISEKNKKEKERIEGLSGNELHEEFLKTFGS
jgi:septal ring factor EnvC (AmiA/AmiB activator)